MNELLQHYSSTQWILMLLAAFFIGMGKAGLKGVDALGIIMMAIVTMPMTRTSTDG
jgi:hypothetical protein